MTDRRHGPSSQKRWADGRIKLALTRRLLRLRQELPAVFRDGDYEPVEVEGPDRDHILAFIRSHRRERVLVVAGRHFARMTEHGCRWPLGWQAELRLDRKSRVGLRDALDSFGTSPDTLAIGTMFKTAAACRPAKHLDYRIIQPT